MTRRIPPHFFRRGSGSRQAPTTDDLTSWPSSGQFTTTALPAGWTETGQNDVTPYYLLFEATKILPAAAVNDVHGLRFTDAAGVRLGHVRTPGNRIMIGGTFNPGPLTIRYYWGKQSTSQPGLGFPTALQMLAPCRLVLIFSSSNPLDISPSPATFTKVGAPTFFTGLNGQAMTCGDGNYVQSTAAKLRGDARSVRTAMVLMRTPATADSGRAICWGDWTTNERGFQLWSAENYVELYIDDDGVSPFQRWVNRSAFMSGWTFIGGSWESNVATALVQRDADVLIADRDFVEGAIPGPIFNAPQPYIVGGTPVAGVFHAGDVECVIELFAPGLYQQMAAFDLAWRTNEQFLGIDQTPDSFDVPEVLGAALSSEVAFAPVQITGISPATPISISGDGQPTYSISSSFSANSDVKAKASTAGTVNPGQVVRSWHFGSGSYSTVTTSSVRVGTVSSARQSTTLAAPGTGGGSGIPEGAATYTVTSLAAGQSVINNQLAPGQILEFADGDYRGQGTLTISGKDWSAGAKAVIRAASHAYRGPHPSDGGLWVANESSFGAGSKGAEFSAMSIRNSKNFVLEGMRLYMGAGMESNWNEFIYYVQNAVFRNCRFAGLRASGYPLGWIADSPAYTWSTERVPQGLAIKEAVGCRFEKCLFQYIKRGTWIIGGNSVYDGCVWTDTGGDSVYMSHANSGQVLIRCVINRTFPSTSTFHCDAVQCTAKDANASTNQLYELCLIGPGNSAIGHTQGIFLEQDTSAYSGPDGVIVKDSLVESRVVNAVYLRPARNCQVQNCTVIQNQFTGIDSANRNTLIWTPQINFNASGTSRGGNIINRTVYMSNTIGAGDTITNSYQLLPGAYTTHLFDYPLYSAGLWRPTMILDDFCKVDTVELKRMAPKTTAPFHPDTADIGAHRLFTHYGVLP